MEWVDSFCVMFTNGIILGNSSYQPDHIWVHLQTTSDRTCLWNIFCLIKSLEVADSISNLDLWSGKTHHHTSHLYTSFIYEYLFVSYRWAPRTLNIEQWYESIPNPNYLDYLFPNGESPRTSQKEGKSCTVSCHQRLPQCQDSRWNVWRGFIRTFRNE